MTARLSKENKVHIITKLFEAYEVRHTLSCQCVTHRQNSHRRGVTHRGCDSDSGDAYYPKLKFME